MAGTRFSAGVVILRRFGEAWRCLMLRAYKNWDFPKGEVEKDESPLEGALREAEEETTLKMLDLRWGEIYRETEPYSGGKVARYFIGESTHGNVLLLPTAELGRPEHHEYRWVGFDEARELAPPRLQGVVAWAQSVVEAQDAGGG